MTTPKRPLSPHIKIYRFPLNGMMSGSHRVTGLLLAIGTFFLAAWLLAAAYGAENFAFAQWFFGSWLGQLMLLGWTACLYYHLVNGIRHLIWDMAKSFDPVDYNRSGLIGLVAVAVLTIGTWLIAYAVA